MIYMLILYVILNLGINKIIVCEVHMKENCDGCKRQTSTDANVILYFCKKCKRIHPIAGKEDYYERKERK